MTNFALLLALVAALPAVPLLRGADLYVSPGGDDRNPGTLVRPLATLERARDTARAAGAKGVTVHLRKGVYRRDRTFELTAEDSGAVYRAYGDEEARLTAAVPVPPSALRPVTNPAVLSRLDPAARGKVVQIDAGALGAKHLGPFPPVFRDGGGIVELWFDGRRMPLSRWPDKGYTNMVRVLDNGDWSNGPSRRGGVFEYAGDRPSRWLGAIDGGLWLDGFWRVPWQPEKVRVKSIDTAKRIITHAEPVAGGIASKYKRPQGDGKEPWYALNLIEEIDRPGEWAIDFRTRTIYFWPPSSGEVSLADMAAPLIRVSGASRVRIERLVFEGGLGDGIEIRGGEGNVVAGCTLRRLGKNGVLIDGGKSNGVESSDFHGLGHGGIVMTGGDRRTLTPAGNFAINNHIHHYGEVMKTYAPGIRLGFGDAKSVGNRVAHNLIHDAPHAAVLYGGNENVLEYNEVHNVALDSGDVGAFYTVLDWASRGNVLRYNFVHHSTAANAFYMDDGDSGDTVFGNVVYKTGYGPFIGGGHDNTVRNNIVVASKRCIHVDARGVPRGYNAANQSRVKALESLNYRQPPWSERYPNLVGILTSNPDLPTGNVIERNVLSGCGESFHLEGGAKHPNLRFTSLRDNLEAGDPAQVFVNPARLDFRFRPEAGIGKKLPGFEPIPFEKIGLYTDRYRRRLPTAEETGRYGDRRAGEGFDSDVDRRATDRPDSRAR